MLEDKIVPYQAREGSNKGQVVNAGDIKVIDIKETHYCGN